MKVVVPPSAPEAVEAAVPGVAVVLAVSMVVDAKLKVAPLGYTVERGAPVQKKTASLPFSFVRRSLLAKKGVLRP